MPKIDFQIIVLLNILFSPDHQVDKRLKALVCHENVVASYGEAKKVRPTGAYVLAELLSWVLRPCVAIITGLSGLYMVGCFAELGAKWLSGWYLWALRPVYSWMLC